MYNKNRNLVYAVSVSVLITAFVTFVASFMLFYNLRYFNSAYTIHFDPEKVDAGSIRKFNEVRSLLNIKFYEEPDQNKMLEGAVAGMAYSLGDPYTVYYNREQFNAFLKASTKSEENYVGVGIPIMLDENGIVTALDPYDDSPAKEAGVQQGDKIIKVNGQDIIGLRDDTIVADMIKGPEGTPVTITVFRPSEGRNIDFTLTRKRIKAIINISSTMLTDKIGYIKIRMFDNDIAKNFQKQLDKLLNQNMKGLIIDVRDNPGGSYEGVISIVDRLIPEGLIVYTEDRNKERKSRYSDSQELGMPIAVLINGNSASASEILAGALKDHNKGILIGTKTFGKGLVQEVHRLSDGSGLKVTVAKYYTPSGVCIQGTGIEPHIVMEMPEKYKGVSPSRIPRDEDVQLLKAISVINGQITN